MVNPNSAWMAPQQCIAGRGKGLSMGSHRRHSRDTGEVSQLITASVTGDSITHLTVW